MDITPTKGKPHFVEFTTGANCKSQCWLSSIPLLCGRSEAQLAMSREHCFPPDSLELRTKHARHLRRIVQIPCGQRLLAQGKPAVPKG